MPYMVNGCGTTYYGKKNVESHQGTCESCNALTTLTSYDTMHWFVLILIPLIPLGRKRINEECASCQRHRVMKLSDWNELHQRMHQTVDAYVLEPADKDKAIEALQASVGFRDLPTFLQIAPVIEENFASDSKTLSLLASCHEAFDRYEDMQRVLQMALEVEDKDEFREGVGLALLRQEKPDDAVPYLKHIYEKVIPDRVGLLYLLAQMYQIKGHHEEALLVFDQVLEVAPHMANDKTFERLRQESVKRQGSSTPVKPAQVVESAKNKATLKLVGKIAAVCCLLAVIGYLILAVIQGQRQTIYLVNGMKQAYDVQVNGKKVTLPPLTAITTLVAQGTVTITSTDPMVPQAKHIAQVHTPFISRPFDDHVFVFNPDQAAVIVKQRAAYASKSWQVNDEPVSNTYLAAQFGYTFTDIDYLFEEMPDSLTVEAGSIKVIKYGLTVMTEQSDVKFPILMRYIADDLTSEQVTAVLKHRYRFEPENVQYLEVLYPMIESDEMIALLKPMLSRRPILLESHRYYQIEMAAKREYEQLLTTYEQMLAKEPDNKKLMYLLARTLAFKDYARAVSLCQQASQGDSPCAYASCWLAGDHLEKGRFHESVKMAELAMEQDQTILGLKEIYFDALMAIGQYDKALTLVQAFKHQPIPECLVGYRQEAYVHLVTGEYHHVQDMYEQMQKRLRGFNPATVRKLIETFKAVMAYCDNQPQVFVEHCLNKQDAHSNYWGYLTGGEVQKAHESLATSDEASYTDHLLVYIAASMHNKPQIAQDAMQRAVDLLKEEGRNEQGYAAILEGDQKATLDKVLQLRMNREDKVVLLTALGVAKPQLRESCFTLVAKLNLIKQYPYLLIEEALAITGDQ